MQTRETAQKVVGAMRINYDLVRQYSAINKIGFSRKQDREFDTACSKKQG
jgi:hypothetical protein